MKEERRRWISREGGREGNVRLLKGEGESNAIKGPPGGSHVG